MPGNGSAEGKDWWGGGARIYSEEANPSGWEGGWERERRRKYIECFLFVQIHLNFK